MAAQKGRHGMGGSLVLGVTLALWMVSVHSLSAQETDSRWLPWMGCWEPAEQGAEDGLLCFRPLEGDAGVEMLTVLTDGEISSSQTLRADGERRETSLEGCAGWDRGEFGGDPGRVYFASEHDCEGGVERDATGLFAMVSVDEWVDISVVDVGGEEVSWVMRYRLATQSAAEAAGMGEIAAGRSMAVRSARIAASTRPTVEDVIEAQQFVGDEGARAWVAERGAPLEIDADRLVRMADAGLSPELIDVVVAVSYPDEFAVDRRAEEGYVDGRYARMGVGPSPFYYGSYWSSFYYSPWGYGYGGYPYFGGYYRPVVVNVGRIESGPRGRIVRGQGYRRGSSSGSSGGGSAVRGGSGSSGGAAASSGSGSRSSGSATGRRAVRRSGGGF